MTNVNFIIDSNSIYGTNSIIKKLDTLIREDMFPRNAWDTPKQRVDDINKIIVDWTVENIHGLRKIRFTVDNERIVKLSFFNGKEFKAFDPESDYSGYSWLVRQEMKAFQEFWIAYFKRVESN